MDFYKIFARKIVIPLWAAKERSPYLKLLRYLKASQHYSYDRLRDLQLEKLKKLMDHAHENCPYYRSLFEKSGFDPKHLKTLDDIKKVPLLTKGIARQNKDSMTAKNYKKEKLLLKKTSGSTGVSMELFIDFTCNEWRRAAAIRHDEWSGWKQGDRKAAIWGNPCSKKGWRPYLRNMLLDRTIYLDTLSMNENDMLRFAHILLEKRPPLIFGHAHSIYLFASFLEKRKINGISARGIISSAMVLHEWQRKKIESVFGCKVFNRYGCEEVSLIASECDRHEGMHINMDSLLVEFLRKDGTTAMPGEISSVVVTDLINYGMPFIRYEIGDLAAYTDRRCSCGRGMPIMDEVVGRDADYIITPEDKLISGISLTENFILKIPGVEYMQIEQRRLDNIRIRMVRTGGFNADSEKILSELSRNVFGPRMQVEYEYVDRIPQERTGKYRFIISRIDKQKIGKEN